jgi:hypothetical protein
MQRKLLVLPLVAQVLVLMRGAGGAFAKQKKVEESLNSAVR